MHDKMLNLMMFYPLFLFSLSFHEAAHGYIAEKFGDDTARHMGRVTLNPLPHLDLVGTVFLPIMGMLTGAPIIGWGKPVPVNPYNLKGDRRRSSLWVAIAGPTSNFLLALVFVGLYHGMIALLPSFPEEWLLPEGGKVAMISGVMTIIQMGVLLNLFLCFFNLIPLPPLDGGSVLRGILPAANLDGFDRFSRYGFLILLALFVTGLLKYLLWPVLLLAGALL
jgi:Zn-dependent protease